jgi:threonine-phosphate decarboxylase
MVFLPPHGGNITLASQVYGLPEDKIIDFSANINPLGPPPGTYEAIMNNLQLITRYPDPASKALKDQLSIHLGVPQNNILVGNGASEIIYLITNSFRPSNVMVLAPTFSEYALASKCSGAKVLEFPLPRSQDYSFQREILSALYTYKIDLLFLCNPNNPIGNLIPPDCLEATLKATVQIGATIVLDESFMDFITQKSSLSMVKEATSNKGLIVLYSLTKFYALAGLRLGCAVASAETIRYLEDRRDPWSVNALAQVAGVKALQDRDFSHQTMKWLDVEKSFLYHKLSQITGLRPLRPEANYICLEISNPKLNSHIVTSEMGKKGLLVRNCANYSNMNQSFIRIAIKTRAQNELLIKGLQELFNF